MRGLRREVLEELDRLIAERGLHARGGSEPVQLREVLEGVWAGYRSLPDEVEAVAVQWRHDGKHFARVALLSAANLLCYSNRLPGVLDGTS